MTTYTVHPLPMAKADRPTATYTYLRNPEERSSVFYGPFLLKSSERNVLVDTGCDAVHYAAGPLPPINDVASLEENLGRIELIIREIDAVVLTHLHFDHTAFLHLFKQCPKFVQERELRAARDPHPYFSFFYVPRFFQDVDFEVIDGDRTLLPGLEVALVAGHSAGSQAVIVETDEGRTAVSGFCCLAKNFETNNFAIPGIHESFAKSHDSMLKLLRLADIVYANHSEEAVKLNPTGL